MSVPPALLVTCDDLLLDDVLRLAAAAGSPLEVAHDATGALRGWAAASVVLLGADLVERVAAQRPPRREHVQVVTSGPAGDEVFRSALAVGAAEVVELPMSEAWLVELLTDAADAADGRHGRPAHVVGVVAGSGGAGATTFACALALTAAPAQTAVLVDLDPLGPGVDRVVGLDGSSGIRWDSLLSSRGRLGSRSLRAALPVTESGLAVLTWELGAPTELDAPSVREVLSAVRRGHDIVVLDLPRTLDGVTHEVVARCDRVLVVVEATIPGVASAGKVAAAVRRFTGSIGLVVRARSGAVPVAHVVAALGLPLVAEVPHQRRLAEQVDLGLGPVHSARSPLARAARTALAAPDERQGAA